MLTTSLASRTSLGLDQYKIELRLRNHNTLTRDKIIPEIAKCVPEGHTVSLNSPELFILVEIFKVRKPMKNMHVFVEKFMTTGRVFAASALSKITTSSKSSTSWRSRIPKISVTKARGGYQKNRRRVIQSAVTESLVCNQLQRAKRSQIQSRTELSAFLK